jgi:hypothetical protein
MIVKFYIEDTIIDLHAEDNIELNNSIANTDDITKINTEYTKTFTVPASDRNNFIFKHYYDADIDNTFDARVKKNAAITLDGLPYKNGRVRLEKVSVKDGNPSSYSITFWGNLVNIKDTIGDDYLSELDLSALNHSYNSSEVKSRLIGSQDIIYNLISNKRQFFYSSDATDNTDNETFVNIAYNAEPRGVVWTELRPSIRLNAFIEAIEVKYGLSFSNDFFNREEFFNLFMWLQSSSEQPPTSRGIDFAETETDIFLVNSYFFDSDDKHRNVFTLTINPNAGFLDTEYTIIIRDFGIEVSRNTYKGDQVQSFLANSTQNRDWSITYEIESASQISYSGQLTVDETQRFTLYTINNQIITGALEIAKNVPKLKVIDFLNGIFKMFKLVVIPLEDGTIYVNTLNDYYASGKILDLTNYVDSNNYDVSRGVLSSQIDFKYQEPTTFLNYQFKLNTGIGYGDEELTLYDEVDANGSPYNYSKILDGDKIEVTLPFEMLNFERLTDLNTNLKSKVQYGLTLDEKLEPNNPKPLIFYNVNSTLVDSEVSFINDGGTPEEIRASINTPSSTLGLSEPNFSILWGSEFNTWDGIKVNNTLFSNYWSKYIQDIFNIKKRNFSFSAQLPSWILTKIQLNDIVKVKDKYYRFNDYTVNLINGKASLNLINNFDTNFNLFAPSQKEVSTTSQAQLITIYVSNSQGVTMNIVLQDLSFGTGWITATQNGSFIDINLTQNTTAADREVFINVDNGAGKSFQIYLKQSQ